MAFRLLNNINTWTPLVINKRQHVVKRNAATIVLMIATFFNPLGFDALFALVMNWTGSYLLTDIIFYFISLLFFGLYFFLRKSELKKTNS